MLKGRKEYRDVLAMNVYFNELLEKDQNDITKALQVFTNEMQFKCLKGFRDELGVLIKENKTLMENLEPSENKKMCFCSIFSFGAKSNLNNPKLIFKYYFHALAECQNFHIKYSNLHRFTTSQYL